MKRFPDIVIVSWQCDCACFMSHSIDEANTQVLHRCSLCGKNYMLVVGDLDVPISIIPPRAHETGTESPLHII